MSQLSKTELSHLRSQSVTSSDWGGRRYPPYAFTEQGVAMLSSVLRSERAGQVNIEIMRTFVRLREILAGHVELARKLTALERKYDAQFKVVFDAIRGLTKPPEPTDIIGMRRRLIHACFEINLDILWETVITDLPPLIASLDNVLPPEAEA